jgi:PTS system nitrogen regulatory IIA component
MHLTLRQAASYLDVSEPTVRRWIGTRGLPAHRVNERLHCNAIELWEWATENGIPVAPGLLEKAREMPEEVLALSTLLADGGVHRDIGGTSRAEVLREVVKALPLPAELDRDFLSTVLEARETMGSTAIGDGIAIPHVRNPILLHVERPFVALCLLRHPVDFGALDGKPVGALFVVVSPNVPAHLRILARLAFVLRDTQLRCMLHDLAAPDVILARIATLEAAGVRGDSRGDGAAVSPAAR